MNAHASKRGSILDRRRLGLGIASNYGVLRDFPAARGDFFVLDYLRDRIVGHLSVSAKTDLDLGLEVLLDAVNEADTQAVDGAVKSLRRHLEG